MTSRKDIERTIAQHFEDKRSYIAPDGREVLYGDDWKARCYTVWCREQGQCEQRMYKLTDPRNFERCKEPIAHVHHKIKRSRSRDDRLPNLEGLCIHHHQQKHPEKQPQWSAKKHG